MEPDDKVELREILGLPHLPPGQHLGSRKVLKVFIVKFTNGGLNFILIFIFILFYSLIFLFLEHRVTVSNSHESQNTENKVEGSRTNDVIQHEHHMLASCSTHGYLG